MNQSEQYNQWKRYNIFLLKIEAKYTKPLLNAISKHLEPLLLYGERYGFNIASGKINNLLNTDGLVKIITQIHWDSAGKYGVMIFKDFKGIKRFGASEKIAAKIIAILRSSLYNNVHGISNTIKERILQIIQDGMDKGYGVDKIARMIREDIGSMWRAQRIVRTESAKAANMGAKAAAEMTGLQMDKVWINAQDNHVRGNPTNTHYSQFDHWDVGGETVSMDKFFWVGGEQLDHPCDPKGSAGNVINCRCCVAYKPKRDNNGRPIRKFRLNST